MHLLNGELTQLPTLLISGFGFLKEKGFDIMIANVFLINICFWVQCYFWEDKSGIVQDLKFISESSRLSMQPCCPRGCHGTPRFWLDQLTLSQPGGTDYFCPPHWYWQPGTPGFSNLPTTLLCNEAHCPLHQSPLQILAIFYNLNIECQNGEDENYCDISLIWLKLP